MSLISFEGLRAKYGVLVSRDTLRIHCRDGRFPSPINIGRRIFWRVSDIERFISAQKQQLTRRKRRQS